MWQQVLLLQLAATWFAEKSDIPARSHSSVAFGCCSFWLLWSGGRGLEKELQWVVYRVHGSSLLLSSSI